MWRPHATILVVIWTVLGSALSSRGEGAAATNPGGSQACRGVAVVSSSIGRDVPAEEILDFVETCGIRLVVIDFAWITHHWPRTDQQAVRRLAVELGKRRVEVAVMYRPRVLRASEAKVHYARDEEGSIAGDHNELCFAHEDSQAWAAEWGKRLLGALPTVSEVTFFEKPDRARRAAAPEESPPALTLPYEEVQIERLPWPHAPPGLAPEAAAKVNRDVWVINDFPLYQADEDGSWRYFHGGLDIVVDNGTKIYAMKDGWVKSVGHSAVAIADSQGEAPCYGWQYAHMGSIQVSKGQFVKKGTWIGSIDFKGLAHLHLSKVFSEGRHWGTWRYECAPNAHFTYVDEDPPVIERPFHFCPNNSDEPIRPSASGTVTVRGAVDIVVGMRDGGRFAHNQENGFGDRLSVARIQYQIVPLAGDRKQGPPVQSFDFRKLKIKSSHVGRAFGTELTKVVYKHWTVAEPVRKNWGKTLAYYVITNCPKDQTPKELDLNYRDCCWDTAELDGQGRPLYPDGLYQVTVTAVDFAGNSSSQSTEVRVANGASE